MSASHAAITAEEVSRVLGGLTADGLFPHRSNISFPKDTRTRQQFVTTIADISAQAIAINKACLLLDVYRTGLILRMTSWLVATRRFDTPLHPDLIVRIATATASEPAWSQHCGVAAILRKHTQRRPRQYEPPPLADEPLRYAERGLHLFELIHPYHLAAESLRMDHCLGRVFSPALAPPKTNDLTNLLYWRRIADRVSRIFSIRISDGSPVATFEFQHKGRRVADIKFMNPGSELTRPAISFMVRGLRVINLCVKAISCFTPQHAGEVLTNAGDWTAYSPDILGSVLCGRVTLTEDAPVTLLPILTGHPGLVLNIPDACRHLVDAIGPHVACPVLASDSSIWPARLESSRGQLVFPAVETGDFSRLQHVGHHLHLPRLSRGGFPRLTRINGSLLIDAAQSVAFPALAYLGAQVIMQKPDPAAFPGLAHPATRIFTAANAPLFGRRWRD